MCLQVCPQGFWLVIAYYRVFVVLSFYFSICYFHPHIFNNRCTFFVQRYFFSHICTLRKTAFHTSRINLTTQNFCIPMDKHRVKNPVSEFPSLYYLNPLEPGAEAVMYGKPTYSDETCTLCLRSK